MNSPKLLYKVEINCYGNNAVQNAKTIAQLLHEQLSGVKSYDKVPYAINIEFTSNYDVVIKVFSNIEEDIPPITLILPSPDRQSKFDLEGVDNPTEEEQIVFAVRDKLRDFGIDYNKISVMFGNDERKKVTYTKPNPNKDLNLNKTNDIDNSNKFDSNIVNKETAKPETINKVSEEDVCVLCQLSTGKIFVGCPISKSSWVAISLSDYPLSYPLEQFSTPKLVGISSRSILLKRDKTKSGLYMIIDSESAEEYDELHRNIALNVLTKYLATKINKMKGSELR